MTLDGRIRQCAPEQRLRALHQTGFDGGREPAEQNWFSGAQSRLLEAFLGLSPAAALSCAATTLVAALAINLFADGDVLVLLFVLPVLIGGWSGSRVIATLSACAAAAATQGPDLPAGASALLTAGPLLLALGPFLLISLLAKEVRRAYDVERRHARLDGLTGALNLRAFHEALGAELARARQEGRSVALAYLDLDHFKEVNDDHGHGAGDRLLKRFCAELTERLLKEDVVGRLGGDEFAVVLAEVHGPCAVERLERIVNQVLARQEFAVTASIGALIIDPGMTISQSQLIVMTDLLMYDVKRNGKAGVRTDFLTGRPGQSPNILAA